MSDRTKALCYAFDFLTFLFLEKGARDAITSVYLFGSAVRDELDEESDIDLFVNCEKRHEDLVLRSAGAAKKKFFVSKDFDKWKGFGFTHPISVKAGPLAEWELRRSIESEGMELFSREPQQQQRERVVLFSFTLPDDKKTYLKIKRELFGRKEKHYTAKGLVAASGGTQLAPGVFLVPKPAQHTFIKIMHANKIPFSMMELSRTRAD